MERKVEVLSKKLAELPIGVGLTQSYCFGELSNKVSSKIAENISSKDFDKQLKEDVRALEDAAGITRRGRGRGSLAAQQPGAHSNYTTLIDKVSTGNCRNRISKHRFLTVRSRRLYSRVILGMKKKGRYYFLTLALVKGCGPIETYWKRFRWWIIRYRPASEWCYCLTDEHIGVIHMVIRLGKHEKRWEDKDIKAYWHSITAPNTHVYIKKCRTGTNQTLARYIQDQKKKFRLGKEMSYQDMMIRWNFSRGWLPVGFTRKHNRLYSQLQRMGLDQEEIQKEMDDLLHVMFKDQECYHD